MNLNLRSQALSIRAKVRRSQVNGWALLAVTALLCAAMSAPASAARVGGARGVTTNWAVSSPGGRQIGTDHDNRGGFGRKIGIDYAVPGGFGRRLGLDMRIQKLVLPLARKGR